MEQLLTGAISFACFAIALFFLQFWSKTRDRFFILFALSFLIEGANRFVFGALGFASETETLVYSVRLFTYLLILAAIVDKNRGTS